MFATEHGFKMTPPRMTAEKPGSPEIFQRPGMGREPAATVPGETESENNFQVFFFTMERQNVFFFSRLSSVQVEDINV